MRYHAGMSSKGPHPVKMHWRGIGTTRKGKPTIGLQTLINIVTRQKKAEVSRREAIDAVKVLDKDPKTRVQHYRDAAVVGGTLSPVVRGIGRGVQAAVSTKGGPGTRAVAFGKGILDTNKGELARHMTEGMLGAGGVKAVQEGVEVGRAKKKLVRYVEAESKVAEQQKEAIDPVAIAGGLAAAKIMGANLLSRHGMALAPIRRIGQEVAGVGFRTAQQGKPMLSRPFREAVATVVDPKLVSAYEASHGVGSRITPQQVAAARQGIQSLTHQVPEVAQHAKFIEGIPLESKGLRRAVDYAFTPVGQVAKDIGSLVRPRQALKTAAEAPAVEQQFTDLVKLSALGTSVTSKSSTVGKFKGFATEHSLKAPGMAASATATNPRRSLVNAISAFKA